MSAEHTPHRITGPVNLGPRRPLRMHADESWLDLSWYEGPREDPAWPEVYTYTDAISYAPGEEVAFRGSTNAVRWSIEIVRDGAAPECVHRSDDLPGAFTAMPEAAYRTGCDWPVRHRWQIPADARSGFYKVISTCERRDGSPFVQHHWFVVRPTATTRRGRLLMILPTATWTAYNDWGGANHYRGIDGPGRDQFSPVLSLQRPWT
ncbi:MAG TPA: N,N-dimethylformamidase beta subunit family domain-containing protein, partial [Acetobacteraceae bacterium]|nr:N,N-dimethylformamidase beta subunit family domain-containing protein [Acetobacteraceae bacterium]